MVNNIINEITPDTDFSEIRECAYKEERYLVRDNGAVYRLKRGDRRSKYDEVWMFGYPNPKKYLTIGGELVHRIVATAFLGPSPYPNMVVDHINTNHMDNHPTNLRWFTRLENILNNEITRKKIILICGSIENFLNNPKLLYGHESEDKNFEWMKVTTKEESKICRDRLLDWAKNVEEKPQGNGMGSWIFEPKQQRWSKYSISEKEEKKNWNLPIYKLNQPDPIQKEDVFVLDKPQFVQSLSPLALQDWITPTEFPLCPTSIDTNNPLQQYWNNLKEGAIFSRNKLNATTILEFAYSQDKSKLCLKLKNMEEDPIQPWLLTEIIFEEGYYKHINKHGFQTEKGAAKYYTLSQGLEWEGGDCMEDYC